MPNDYFRAWTVHAADASNATSARLCPLLQFVTFINTGIEGLDGFAAPKNSKHDYVSITLRVLRAWCIYLCCGRLPGRRVCVVCEQSCLLIRYGRQEVAPS